MATDRTHPAPVPPWQPTATPAPGFVEISLWSSRTVNGIVVECSYTNLAHGYSGRWRSCAALVVLAWGRRFAGGPAAGSAAALAIGVGALHVATALGGLDLPGQNPC